jgi:hypothetical protein
MDQDVMVREVGWTIKRVTRFIPKDRSITKSEFGAVIDEILRCLHRNRKISIESLAEKTEKILTELPNEYGRLPESDRSWEKLVGYLYIKYLKEVGQL